MACPQNIEKYELKQMPKTKRLDNDKSPVVKTETVHLKRCLSFFRYYRLSRAMKHLMREANVWKMFYRRQEVQIGALLNVCHRIITCCGLDYIHVLMLISAILECMTLNYVMTFSIGEWCTLLLSWRPKLFMHWAVTEILRKKHFHWFM